MSTKLHSLRVSRVVEETPASRTFVFDVPAELEDTFAYQAGQFLTIETPWDDFRIRRCYSLCTAPAADDAPAVTVKRVAEGRMSNWLIDNVQAGDTLDVLPPAGHFVLDPSSGSGLSARPLLLFAAGSGITPVIGLLEQTMRTTERRAILLYANTSRDSVIFHDRLAALHEEYGVRCDVRHHLDSEGGFLTADDIRDHVGPYTDADCYVCGPTPFMDIVEAGLLEAGASPSRMHFERFVSPADPDRQEETAAVPDGAEHPADFTVTLRGRARKVPYKPGLTLLAACQDAGVSPPSSCEDGFCGSCMATLVEGDVVMAKHEALSEQDIASGRVLMCQAHATSAAPIHIDCDQTTFRAGADGDDVAPPLPYGRFAAVMALSALGIWLVRFLH